MEPLDFIKLCVRRGKIYWTYHVNMRLHERYIPRTWILNSTDSYEIIEKYPEDKYLPSYLVYARHDRQIFHIHIALDENHDMVRIITTYKPSQDKWEVDGKTRRKP